MTQTHSTTSDLESTNALGEIEEKMESLGLPFPEHFARALVGLLSGKKITLHEVANLMPGEKSHDANRQQMRRNLDHPRMQGQVWSKSIAPLLPKGAWVLALDRTTWERGTTVINLLVLAVVVHGCAVPLLWTVMPETGNSDTKERIELMQQFLDLFGAKRWRFLTLLSGNFVFLGGWSRHGGSTVQRSTTLASRDPPCLPQYTEPPLS